MTDVSSATKFFSKPQEGFTTTTSGAVSSGASTVGLSGTGNYSNGDVVVLIIEPGVSGKEQAFTGTIDVGGSQVTGVVWIKGTNSAHSGGVTVADYVAAGHLQLISTGILVEHNQDGTHDEAIITSRTEDTSPATGDFVLTSDVSASNALKKVQLGNISTYKVDKSLLTTDSNPYKFSAYRNSFPYSLANAAVVIFDTEDFDTNSNYDATNGRYTAPVAGFYHFDAALSIGPDTSTHYWSTSIAKNGTIVKRGVQISPANTNAQATSISVLLQLAASDYVEIIMDANATSTTTLNADSRLSWFCGFLISKT